MVPIHYNNPSSYIFKPNQTDIIGALSFGASYDAIMVSITSAGFNSMIRTDYWSNMQLFMTPSVEPTDIGKMPLIYNQSHGKIYLQLSRTGLKQYTKGADVSASSGFLSPTVIFGFNF